MKNILLAFLALTSSSLAAGPIVIRVTDEKGALVPKADVVLILKSGAFQNGKPINGARVFDEASEPAKLYAAAAGYESAEKRISSDAGEITIVLKASSTKNSAIIRGAGPLPGIKGTVNPILDGERRTYIYANKIGLEQGGKPAVQPLYFSINQPISAQAGTGERFKIYVKDITQSVSLVEFTTPK